VVSWLLDTNVLSELARPRPDEGVLARFAEIADDAAIAAVVWHELRFGVERLPSGRRRDALAEFVSGLASRFPVLPYDRRAAEWHAVERARLESIGTPAPFADGQIAAVAVTNGLRLSTRNVADFGAFADLAVESWWAAR
jgi:tRNA(fMet)-specific endonuclease VapC